MRLINQIKMNNQNLGLVSLLQDIWSYGKHSNSFQLDFIF